MPKILDKNWKHKENRNTLICKDCKGEFDKSFFLPRGKTTSGTQKYDPRCHPCRKEFSKQFDSIKRVHGLVTLANERKVKCEICHYDRYKGALDFHHKDPSTKIAEISDLINWVGRQTTTVDTLIAEMDKCVVLCSNCHREVHAGITKLE